MGLSVRRVGRGDLLSGDEELGTAEVPGGTAAVANSPQLEVGQKSSEHDVFPLRLHWPARSRGVWRHRKSAAIPSASDDHAVNFFR
jgi:hypothetical protein